MERLFNHRDQFPARDARAASEFGLEMRPTVLMMGIEEKFPVAFCAEDRGFP